MKKSVTTISLILSIVMIFCFVSCGAKVESTGLWENATYLSDTTVGKGSSTVSLDVEAEGQKITITIKTDATTLGDAMFENGLVENATFFSVLNGIEASWEKDMAYWAFYQGENFMMHGIGDEPVTDGAHYRFVYTK